MAEKPEDQYTSEERIAKAKELYGRGCRNYYVKSFSEAADDLSEASKLFGEEYGVDGDELGDVYLLYAKALIAIGQEENKLVEIREQDRDFDDEIDEGVVDEPTSGKLFLPCLDTRLTIFHSLTGEESKDPGINGGQNGEVGQTNGHAEEEPQAGPSSANDNESSSNDVPVDKEPAAEEDDGDFETAWEVLLNASAIFERQGTAAMSKLMECYIEMGGISLENGNFEVAINDFSRASDIFLDLDVTDQNQRIAAEIQYKIGLCQSMIKHYEESGKSFQRACALLDIVIDKEKSREDQSEEVKAVIKDLQETQQEILNKIIENSETKAEELEFVKRELARMYGGGSGAQNGSSDGAGPSSSSSSAAAAAAVKSPEKPATDISHLIKRKKPDNESSIEESPAKKKAVETSPGEKIAIPMKASPEAKDSPAKTKSAESSPAEKAAAVDVTPEAKAADEPETVPVIQE